MIGIKPLFDGDEVNESSAARSRRSPSVPTGTRVAAPGVTWKLERVETDYQWYRSNGRWNYELVTTTQRVATGTIDATADGAATVSAKVDWGSYRLTVESEATRRPRPASSSTPAGTRRGTSDTPDVLRSRSTSRPTGSARRRSSASTRASPASRWSRSSTTG